MTYIAKEQSEFGGSPYELYLFTVDGVNYRFTDANFNKTISGFTWQAEQIRHDEINQTQDINRNTLQITTAQEFPITRLFLGPIRRAPIGLIIYRAYRNDTELGALWVGTVRSGSIKNDEGVLYGETTLSSVAKQGLTRTYGYSCQNFLYDQMCGLNAENFGADGNVTSVGVDGTVIDVSNASYGLDYFTAGFIKRVSNNDTRFIVAHNGGSQFTLLTPFVGLATGEQMRFYKGCKHTTDACKTFFNGNNTTNPSGTNIENYGGYIYIPLDNPFVVGLK